MRNRTPTHIDLQPNDAAFVLKADGKQEIYMPDLPGDQIAPPHVELATMLAIVLNDQQLREYVRGKWMDVVNSQPDDDTPATVAPSPDLQPGTLVEAIKPLDPEGANIDTGTRGVVFHERNYYRDHAGPAVMWMTGGMCSIYEGDVKVIREINC